MIRLNEPGPPASVHPRWTNPVPEPKAKVKPTATLRRPGPPAAVLLEDRTADLVAPLKQYRDDATFRAALIDLAGRLLAEHGEATAALACLNNSSRGGR